MNRIGEYILDSKLGAGSMSIVYSAHHSMLNTRVAVKVMNPELSSNSSYRTRFSNEAKAMAELRHPNIVTLFDYIDDGDNLAIVMELVVGRTLDEMIENETGPVPWERSIQLFSQMVAGLDYAHTRRIIHRDIKPLNIMVTGNDIVKIMDMGIARKKGEMRLTRAGMQMGTLFYNSPEVVKGEDHTMRSDIYALGMTLYEMLTGRMPLEKASSTEFSVMNAIIHEDLPDPREFYPHIPAWIVGILRRSLAKDPSDRYSTCAELRTELIRGMDSIDEEEACTDRMELEDVPSSPYANSEFQPILRSETRSDSLRIVLTVIVSAAVFLVLIKAILGIP